MRCLKAAAVLADGPLGEVDLRTFSRRTVGDSKFIERNMGRVVGMLRHLVDVPEEFDPEEALASLGVVRFAQPCLVAGPVAYRGAALPTAPYVGVPPEMAPELSVHGAPPWLLTVENLASFNRQVREAPGDGVIVYTGGFPSAAVVACVRTLATSCDCRVFHWGDIDNGGVKIARCLEVALAAIGRRLELHLMEPGLAASLGTVVAPTKIFKKDVSDSVVTTLADFLASPGAHVLEQEELDPTLPSHSIRM